MRGEVSARKKFVRCSEKEGTEPDGARCRYGGARTFLVDCGPLRGAYAGGK
jgi:hypothetical protein